MRPSPALGLYLAASRGAGPLARALQARRAVRGKEDPARLGERLGRPSAPRPAGRLAWLHGASVGEGVSMLPLIAALRAAEPGLGLLVTTGTVASATRLASLLPEGAAHQYAPVDTARAVRGFLAHWRPDLALWFESELWPRLLLETAAGGTPVALLNARLSERSARRWARLPAMAARLAGAFSLIVAQDRASAERLEALGAPEGRVRVGGNLKSAVEVPGADPAALAEARAAVGARPVWLAASTHEGEEAALAEAHAALPPDTLLVLAPRHPDRGDAVAGALEAAGLALARRSRGERPGPSTRVWLADTLGEMALWYRLAPVAFVGGSLVARGGHTPFEPAALGSAILHGPHVENFAPAYAALAEAGGAVRVESPEALAAALGRLLADAPAREAMAEAARGVRARLAPDVAALAREVLALAPAWA
jgi:3-deoxy-D-manno-octulosonic-acid transferase